MTCSTKLNSAFLNMVWSLLSTRPNGLLLAYPNQKQLSFPPKKTREGREGFGLCQANKLGEEQDVLGSSPCVEVGIGANHNPKEAMAFQEKVEEQIGEESEGMVGGEGQGDGLDPRRPAPRGSLLL